jgi:hypothetical protein
MSLPDVVGLVRTYLDGLHAIPVVSKVPEPRPAEFIQIRRIGGAALPPVRDLPRVDIFCWSTGGPEAMTLGNTVRAQMFALARTAPSGVQCYRVEESLFRQFDDPETGQARSWGTYALILRADEILPA